MSITGMTQVVINEYSAANLATILDNYGNNEDWIELYNTSASTVNIGGFYLSDNPSDSLKWQFPENVTIAGHGFLKIWASGRNEVLAGNYHTNFKFTQTKDTPDHIIFSNAFGEKIEDIVIQITRKEHSRGRTSNGADSWSIFASPTPGSSNDVAIAYQNYAAKPVMDLSAGFYVGSQMVSISTTEPNSEIRYTIDGSEPISSSPLYTAPVPVNATTIINAVTYSNNTSILKSLITFNTYFIDVTHTVGVMSASAAQLDDLLNGNQSLKPFGTFEYFNEAGERTTIGYGEFNEHGQDSWVHPHRSIDYITRDECGYNYAIREPLIPLLTDRDEFQRIILRAAGDDNYPGIDTSALLRDFFVENTAERNHMHLDVRKGEKGVLYVNGIYWGVYGFREKVNDHDFTKYYYDQDKYHLYFLMLWGGSWAEYGGQPAWDDWNDLHDFIKYNDMGIQSNYEYVKTRFDYTSLVDYILINSFVVCSDWINWNVGWWRGTDPNGGHQKWGYILWDEDATFAHYINYTGVPGISPYVPPCFPEGLTSDPEEHIVLLNNLLDNDEFRTYYISRYIDLYNTAFQPQSMISYLDTIEAKMLPEMYGQVARWGGTVEEWQTNVQKIRNFISQRHGYLPSGLIGCYNLNGPYEVNFEVVPEGAGTLTINSLQLQQNTWGGNYFGGVDTRLLAVPNSPQFKFDHWELYNNTVSPSDTLNDVTVDFTTGDYIKAVFSPVLVSDSLVINEINYNSSTDYDTEDWVEFYNPHTDILDISGWKFKDSDDTHVFEFPNFTVLAPNSYLVLCRDTTLFHSFFPAVENVIGNMDFGLSGSGELIRLFNEADVLIDTVHYGDSLPWPTEADGNGPTLELKYWTYDNALPESWIASQNHGTPGEQNGYVVSVPMQKKEEKLSFTIYPNPMQQKATLRITSGKVISNGVVEIANIFGQVIEKIQLNNTSSVSISRNNLQTGIYFVKVFDKDNDVVVSQKLMVD